MLAIDTSDSMAGARFDAAKPAATTFLDTVPDDVRGRHRHLRRRRRRPSSTRPPTATRPAPSSTGSSSAAAPSSTTASSTPSTSPAPRASARCWCSPTAPTPSATPLGDVTAAIDDSDGVVVDVVALEQSRPQALATSPTIAGDDRRGDHVRQRRPRRRRSPPRPTCCRARSRVEHRRARRRRRQPGRRSPVTLPVAAGDVVAQLDGPGRSTAPPRPTDALGAVPRRRRRPTAAGTPGLAHLRRRRRLRRRPRWSPCSCWCPAKPVAMSAEDRVVHLHRRHLRRPAGRAKDRARDRAHPAGQRRDRRRARPQQEPRRRGSPQRLEAAGSELKSVGVAARPRRPVRRHRRRRPAARPRQPRRRAASSWSLGVVGPWVYLGIRRHAPPQGVRRRAARDPAADVGLALGRAVADAVGRHDRARGHRADRLGVPAGAGRDPDRRLARGRPRRRRRPLRQPRLPLGRHGDQDPAPGRRQPRRAAQHRRRRRCASASTCAARSPPSPPRASCRPSCSARCRRLFLLYLLVGPGRLRRASCSPTRAASSCSSARGLWLGVGVFWMSKLVKVEV